MTAFNVIKSLTKRGNVVLGSGCYAAAIDSKDLSQVIKIGNNMEDPWLEYYHLIIKNNQHNPHVPKVKYFMCDEQHSYYICIMERLDEETYIGASNYKHDLAELCKDFTSSMITEQEFLAFVTAFVDAVPEPALLVELLLNIRNFTEVFVGGGSCDSNGDFPYSERKLDMHRGNFLFRDAVLVVTDPWCESDMSGITDVSDWLSSMRIQTSRVSW